MSMISIHAPAPTSIGEGARRQLAQLPRRVKLVIAAAMLLAAAGEIWFALQPRAEAIAGGLASAAADVAALPWSTQPEEVQRVVARDFPNEAVRVDPAHFPAEVLVALNGVDQRTCRATRRVVGRIEGAVVVALDGYRSTADCRAENTMTWRIMP
jgi:hypothetical protein